MATKKQLLQEAVAKAIGAGKAVALETVDFNDPNRLKTCLEVDFPILPVNQVVSCPPFFVFQGSMVTIET